MTDVHEGLKGGKRERLHLSRSGVGSCSLTFVDLVSQIPRSEYGNSQEPEGAPGAWEFAYLVRCKLLRSPYRTQSRNS